MNRNEMKEMRVTFYVTNQKQIDALIKASTISMNVNLDSKDYRLKANYTLNPRRSLSVLKRLYKFDERNLRKLSLFQFVLHRVLSGQRAYPADGEVIVTLRDCVLKSNVHKDVHSFFFDATGALNGSGLNVCLNPLIPEDEHKVTLSYH